MRHIKLESCESTQLYLKDLLEKSNDKADGGLPLLISCETQNSGIGRGNHTWDHLPNGLAFSFAFSSGNPVSMPIFVGAFLAEWFEKKFRIRVQVKWPNDLFFQGEKVGGILCHLIGNKTVVVGVGINWGRTPTHCQWKSLFSNEELKPEQKHELAKQIAGDFLIWERSKVDPIKVWTKHCCHLNKNVSIEDAGVAITGFFSGITDQGLALIKTGDKTEQVINGHLTILDTPS